MENEASKKDVLLKIKKILYGENDSNAHKHRSYISIVREYYDDIRQFQKDGFKIQRILDVFKEINVLPENISLSRFKQMLSKVKQQKSDNDTRKSRVEDDNQKEVEESKKNIDVTDSEGKRQENNAQDEKETERNIQPEKQVDNVTPQQTYGNNSYQETPEQIRARIAEFIKHEEEKKKNSVTTIDKRTQSFTINK